VGRDHWNLYALLIYFFTTYLVTKIKLMKHMTVPHTLDLGVIRNWTGYPLPDVPRLGSSFSCCAPAATNPKVYAECYAACATASRGGITQAVCSDYRTLIYMWSRAAPSGRMLRPAVAYKADYSISPIPGVLTARLFGQTGSIFLSSALLLVRWGVYSYHLPFYWSDGEYIPIICPSIGQTGSIFL
jgi:hypothetical protein